MAVVFFYIGMLVVWLVEVTPTATTSGRHALHLIAQKIITELLSCFVVLLVLGLLVYFAGAVLHVQFLH